MVNVSIHVTKHYVRINIYLSHIHFSAFIQTLFIIVLLMNSYSNITLYYMSLKIINNIGMFNTRL